MNSTVIVAGITRSGLSLSMQMLDAGGFPVLGKFPAYEPYKLGCVPWDKAAGKAVKLVDSHYQLPPEGQYRVIRLARDVKEQAKSMRKFLAATGIKIRPGDGQLIMSIERDYKKIDRWADKQEAKLVVNFEDLILGPRTEATRISEFVGRELDIDKMAKAVIERGTACYPTLLEDKLFEQMEKRR